ncbi:MAG TPA: hypothetical protein VKJ01_21645 [Candidatus Solibacter sp.]|nr:hypothetical protein [Candidatus Solibacter sp.]
MKTLTLSSIGTLCLAVFACSTAAEAPPTAVGGATSAGGTGTTGGTNAMVSGGTGGNSSIAGTSSGGTSSGGTVGSGGTGGSVATGGSGGVSGSAGTGASSGGSGGTGGGSAGTGGASAGGSGGGGAVDTTLVGAWDGALLEYPCAKASTSGYDCANVNCSGTPSTATATKSWTIGGTAGTVYNVTFRVRGVVEVTYYLNTKRDADVANNNMNTSITVNGNLFARGGTPQTSSGQSYDYNTYEMDVTPPVTGAENVYYLNSVDMNENPHSGGSTTTHLTFKVDYTATIKVPGGGTVTLKSFDSNCALVMNCATSSTNQCATHYSVDLTGAMPPAPTTFQQPYSQNNGYGQWVFFDITGVAVAQ